MSSSYFVVLQTLATGFLAAATERLLAHDYIMASILAVVGIVGYVVYEVVPSNK